MNTDDPEAAQIPKSGEGLQTLKVYFSPQAAAKNRWFFYDFSIWLIPIQVMVSQVLQVVIRG